MSGKSLKKPLELNVFLPKYFEEKKVEKSLEQQRKEMEAFKIKYHKVRKEAGLE